MLHKHFIVPRVSEIVLSRPLALDALTDSISCVDVSCVDVSCNEIYDDITTCSSCIVSTRYTAIQHELHPIVFYFINTTERFDLLCGINGFSNFESDILLDSCRTVPESWF